MRKAILILTVFFVSLLSFGQTVIFNEDFEATGIDVTTYSEKGTGDWDVTTNYSNGGLKSDTAVIGLNDTLYLEIDSFSTIGYVYVSIDFSHICKIDFFDEAKIEYSIDSGSTWVTLKESDYRGSGSLSLNAFSSTSYGVWDPLNSGTKPAASWWRDESYNLSAAAGKEDVRVRFLLIDTDNNGALGNYGWLIDDIEITGSTCELEGPEISLKGIVLQGTVYSQGPFYVQAEVADTSGVSTAKLVYTVNSGANDTLTMIYNTTTTYYTVFIPSVAIGDTVDYFIYGIDKSACSNKGESTVTQFISKLNPPPTCSGTVTNFDYSESFSSFTPGNGRNSAGTFANNWGNTSTGDDHDWWIYNRQTRSRPFGTGPTADHSTTDANYIYVEASNHFNETAYLLTPCYDFSSSFSPKLSFWYHMFGPNMGDLHLDVYFGGAWKLDIMPVIVGNQGDNWLEREVDLSAYAGNTVKFRFRAITGGGFGSDIAIDDIEIVDPIRDDIEVRSITQPTIEGCASTSAESITIEVINHGVFTEDTIPVGYKVNNGTAVVDTIFFALSGGASINHTFQKTFDMSAAGNYRIDVWHDLANDQNPLNDSVVNYNIARADVTTQFPDTTDFENFDPANASDMKDGWFNGPNDYWFVETGGTPSTATGPTADHTTGSGNYVYMEANGFPIGQTEATIISKCYDISNLNKPEAFIYYNMSGLDMGELHFDLYTNGFLVRDIAPSISGDQGTAWKQQIIDLTLFKGTIRLAFRGVNGSGFRSDIAIDDVIIEDALPVGLEEKLESTTSLQVFPNPVNSLLSIVSTLGSNKEIVIQDATARIVYRTSTGQNITQVDVSSLEAGVYFISVLTSDAKESIKFIKQ